VPRSESLIGGSYDDDRSSPNQSERRRYNEAISIGLGTASICSDEGLRVRPVRLANCSQRIGGDPLAGPGDLDDRFFVLSGSKMYPKSESSIEDKASRRCRRSHAGSKASDSGQSGEREEITNAALQFRRIKKRLHTWPSVHRGRLERALPEEFVRLT